LTLCNVGWRIFSIHATYVKLHAAEKC